MVIQDRFNYEMKQKETKNFEQKTVEEIKELLEYLNEEENPYGEE